jgi:hypothetical protein
MVCPETFDDLGLAVAERKDAAVDTPLVFGKLNLDPSSATPFVVPKDAPEKFLR